MDPLEDLHAAIRDCTAELLADAGPLTAAVKLERPPRAELGDYSTNAALLLAPRVGAPPREVAGRLGAALDSRLGGAVSERRSRAQGSSTCS